LPWQGGGEIDNKWLDPIGQPNNSTPVSGPYV
jgi:hypothetical protein